MKTLGDLKSGPVRFTPTASGLDLSSAIAGLRSSRSDIHNVRRIDQARHSVRRFCEIYLPHHFTAGFSELHDDIFSCVDGSQTSKRIARIAPRQFGKTTIISLGLPLYVLAYRLKWFILMIGESATTAEANLATLTQELETNDTLVADFPHLLPAMDVRGQSVKWTDRQLVVKSYATIMAKGMGARMRGLKYRERRPDLAILDDPESPETADTFLKRRRHKRWFGGTFMGLGARDWDLYVIGNLPHHDCLIADLVLDQETWNGKLYRAINIPPRDNERYRIGNTKTDNQSLWPEVWSLEKLEKYKNEPNVGTLGFAREMMNDPREEEDKVFDPFSFKYFQLTEDHLSSFVSIAAAFDPAGGERPGEMKRGRRDYACIVTAGRTRDGFIDIFDIWMKRDLPDQQIDKLLDIYQTWQPRILGAEENMYKNLLEFDIARRARERTLYPAWKMLRHSSNKVARILGIQPLIESGIVRFAEHLVPKHPLFFGQFDEFPGADHDDAPDATEMVIRLLEKGGIVGLPSRSGDSSKNSYWRNHG
jgi:predicted phage terminase large subunit-like protein